MPFFALSGDTTVLSFYLLLMKLHIFFGFSCESGATMLFLQAFYVMFRGCHSVLCL